MSLNTLRLRSPADVVSAIPYLIGFHPADSVVVLSCDTTQGTCAMRLDLGADEALLSHIAELVARRRPEAVILAGYGVAARVTPTIERLRGHLQARGVPLRDALRVEGGRFWSYLCSDLSCCPAEGTYVDVATNPATAAAVAAGLVALPDRGQLERTLKPAGGEAMREALARAESDFAEWGERGAKNGPASGAASGAGPGTRSDAALTGPDAGPNAVPGAGPNTGPRTGPDVGPRDGSEAGLRTGTAARPRAATGAGPRAATGVGPRAGVDARPGAVPRVAPGPVPDARPSAGTGTGAGPMVDSGARPRAGTGVRPEAGPSAGTGIGPMVDSGAGPRTGAGREAGVGAGERAASDAQAGAGTRDGPGMGVSAEVGAESVADDGASARMVMEGVPLVRRVIDQARAGADLPSADEIAWLGLLLTSLRVRDEAWVRMEKEDLQAHIRLWKNVLTRLPEAYAAAPACLLSFAAWRSGDGALANIALDRALAADPHYTMARLLQELFISGLPPWSLRLGLTPDDLDETG